MPDNGAVPRVNRLLLLIGLPVVIVVGLALPGLGQSVGAMSIGPLSFSDLCVIAIFLVSGLQVRLTGVRDPALVRALGLVLGINLLLAPIIGWIGVRTLDLTLGLVVGLALMASVPTTLSSATVIAVNAGGDRLWALALTIVTVLVGSVTAPLAVSAILSQEIALDPWPIFASVVALVLGPTITGYLLGRFLWPRPSHWLAPLPSAAVLAVVWVTISSNATAAREISPGLLMQMAAAAVVVHGVLLAVAWVASRRMPVAQAMPVLFVASQKTLPLALAVLAILCTQVPEIAAVSAVATVACLVWQFLQLFVDSALSSRASRLGRSSRTGGSGRASRASHAGGASRSGRAGRASRPRRPRRASRAGRRRGYPPSPSTA